MRRTRLCASVLDAIGWTPLVELNRIGVPQGGRILAKLEYLNPGHSKKDRIALAMIEEAERTAELAPGQTVVELTSGNAGTGLAIVCAVRGHPFVAVMSHGNSVERARMMRALGAEVLLVDQLPESTLGQVSGGDLELVERVTEDVVRERGAFRANRRPTYHRGHPSMSCQMTGCAPSAAPPRSSSSHLTEQVAHDLSGPRPGGATLATNH